MAGPQPSFQSFPFSFKDIIGSNPKITLLIEKTDYPFAHEAGVYVPSTDSLFITSNQFPSSSGDINSSGGKKIQISRIFDLDGPTCNHEEIHPDIPMANGGLNYKDGVLFCSQGTTS